MSQGTIHRISDTTGTGTYRFSVSIKANDVVTIHGLQEGDTYTITERSGGYITYLNGEESNEVPNTTVGKDMTSNVGTFVNISKTDITVEKKWDDGAAADRRPDSIVIDLLADGEVVGTATVTADKDGKWSHTFKDLPEYTVDGKKITYNVKERDVEGYESSVQRLGNHQHAQARQPGCHQGG